jgi:triosephosphate isomerase
MHGDEIADDTRILYGGSVNANNISEFVSMPEIDGALVGGASLDAEQFVRIVAVTNEVRNRV